MKSSCIECLAESGCFGWQGDQCCSEQQCKRAALAERQFWTSCTKWQEHVRHAQVSGKEVVDPRLFTGVAKASEDLAPVEECDDSPRQFCRMACQPRLCPTDRKYCAMRIGHCCDMMCKEAPVQRGLAKSEGTDASVHLVSVDECADSPRQLCRRKCEPFRCPTDGTYCAMRIGSCCDMRCKSNGKPPVEPVLAKSGAVAASGDLVAVEECADSPRQLCRMKCLPFRCPTDGTYCAMRIGSCCDMRCKSNGKPPVEPVLAKSGAVAASGDLVAVDECADSPRQFCRMKCEPFRCPTDGKYCGMRIGHCCNMTCKPQHIYV